MKEHLQKAYANLQILICIFALSAAAAFAADTVDVQFVVGDFTSSPQTVKRITLYPVSINASNATQLVTGDRRIITTDAAGSALFTNVMCGTYRSEIFGTSIVTTNLFHFPCGTNGVVNAKDWQIQGQGFLMWEEAGVIGGQIQMQP